MGNPTPKALFAIAVLLAATGVSGCVTGVGANGGNPEQLAAGQTADYFMMEPARLEKGHIFMRRTPEQAQKEEQTTRQTARQNNLDPETIRNQELLLMEEGGIRTLAASLPPHMWQDLKKAKVRVHVENKPFQALIEDVVDELEPRVGPWRIQWKITRENRDVLDERFSLNTETTFDRFISSVAAFMLNYRGLELNFEQFEKERVLVISDVFPM